MTNKHSKGFAAHYLIGTEHGTLRNSGITVNENGIVTSVFSLENSQQEKPSTIFCPGCITIFKTESPLLDGITEKESNKSINTGEAIALVARTLEEEALKLNIQIQVGEKVEIYNYKFQNGQLITKKML